jgi:hypothetical protein
MIHNAGANHVQIDVNQALQQVFARFDRCRVIPILSKCAFAAFPLVVFLSRTTRDQLNRSRNRISFTIIHNQQVDMIRSRHKVQNYQPIPLLRFEKPLHPSPTIFLKPEQKLSFMASVRNVPNLPGDVMSFRSRHRLFPINPFLPQKKSI